MYITIRLWRVKHHDMKKYREVEVELNSFWTSAMDGCKWPDWCSGCSPTVPNGEEPENAHSRSRRAGNWTAVVQSQGSRHIHRAISRYPRMPLHWNSGLLPSVPPTWATSLTNSLGEMRNQLSTSQSDILVETRPKLAMEKYYYGYQINEDEMGGSYSTYGTDDKCVQYLSRITRREETSWETKV